MTNFNGAPSGVLTRERVLRWAPVLVGGTVAVLAGVVLLIPAWQRLQQVAQKLQDLQAQQKQLPLLRRQLSTISERRTQAALRQRRILELIQGSGEWRTFLAQLNLEARASGVQLVGYEPIQAPAAPPQAGAGTPAAPQAPAAPPGAAAPAAGAAANPGDPPPPPPDPLEGPGLRKSSLLLRARGKGLQLQQFLRRLERLGLLLVQSDLSIKLEPSEPAVAGKPVAAKPVEALLSLTLSLYLPDASAEPRP